MSFFLIVFGTTLVFIATAPLIWRLVKPAERTSVLRTHKNYSLAEVRADAPLKQGKKPF